MSELKQNTDERVADYYTRLREIVKKCDYGTHENDTIRDHLIQTMINNNVRSKAIHNNWVLDRYSHQSRVRRTNPRANQSHKQENKL